MKEEIFKFKEKRDDIKELTGEWNSEYNEDRKEFQ